MAELKSSVAPRARTRADLDGRKNGKNGNFAAESSKLTAKERKGGTFMKEGSKRGSFSSKASENHGKTFVISSSDDDDAFEERDESSSESESEDYSDDEEETTESESEESPKEKEQRVETVLIEVSSGDEDATPVDKTYDITAIASRTRSKQTGSHAAEMTMEPSCASNQHKRKQRPQPESRSRPGKSLQHEKPDKAPSDMLSSTRRSSEEEVGSASGDDSGVARTSTDLEATKRKELFRKAVKTGRKFSEFLTNSMWEEEDEIANWMQPETGEVMEVLPRKFNFRIEEKKVEKTEEEKEMEGLWEEMELGLINDRIGSSAVQDRDGEEQVFTAGICPKGQHQFIFNEEIGIICSICSYVETEIRSVFPSMEKVGGPWKSRYRDDYRRPLHDLDMNGDDASEHGSSSLDEEQFTQSGTVWDLVPRNIKTSLFPHQKEGFEFMWKNLGGSIDLEELRRRSSADQFGGGCIISHAPGTGKTRLTLVFLKAYTELFPKSRPIVIAPASMLLTWEEEFKKCKIDIPFHNLNNDDLSMKEKHEILELIAGNSHLKNKDSIRTVKLYSWSKATSVLGISYPLFVKLVHSPTTSKILLEMPGVVVLDEGHTPRNGDSSMWNTLCKLKSKRRIILSGTPFQNNCNELLNTLKLVRPREEKHVSAKLDNLKMSSKDDCGRKAAILKTAVAPFAHVYKGSILQKDLPGLRNYAVVLNPTEYQAKILESLQNCGVSSSNALEFEHKQAIITVHPSLVLHCKLLQKEEQKIESEKEKLTMCRGDPQQGAKTRFVLHFISLCMAVKEKVLVFGQYKEPLKLIMEQLCTTYNWRDGEEVLTMNGNIDQRQRQIMIGRFNDPDNKAMVLLASIKACCEGINLVGASRVILLDVVWNPSVERQAISRAYRLGQKKVVYTYHLMMKGSNEGDRYIKQARKQKLSEFMFSNSSNGDVVVGPPTQSEDRLLDMMSSSVELDQLFHEVIFQPRENNLIERFGLVD